jgi:cyclophilin family peptidyl-prolyl cis-trans isomerase
MRKLLIALAVLAAPVSAQDKPAVPSPSEIVAAAPKGDWTAIAASDLLVMELAPPDQSPGQASAKGRPRRVVIQLMPPPFSQGWIGNIRKLAAAQWWDGLSVNRVQDNYVVQWGDAAGEDKAKAKALPESLAVVPEGEYTTAHGITLQRAAALRLRQFPLDPYAPNAALLDGWPIGYDTKSQWPVHCYGMVGVGRDMPPDTGSGAELYLVIGHAPRHLDRNIALVGRVIEGIEHLSSLPRGTGALGFYETAEERMQILSLRLGSEVPGLPAFEVLWTNTISFARYANARANRRDPFFIRPAGGADICNIPVPVRRVK